MDSREGVGREPPRRRGDSVSVHGDDRSKTQFLSVSSIPAPALDQALRLLLEALDSPYSDESLAHVANRADIGPAPPWPQALTRMGADVGLNLAAHGAPIQDLFQEGAAAAMPWLTIITRGGLATPLVVLEATRRKARIQMPGEDSRWISRRGLTELLDPEAADGSRAWVSAEPAAPLDGLRSPSPEASWDHKPLPRLLALLRAEREDLWVVVGYSVAIGLLSLVVPVAVQSLVNTVAFGSLLQPLAVLTMAVLGALGFRRC